MNGIIERIIEAKRRRGILVLAHNYTDFAVQQAADIVGDSLALALEARRSDAERVVVCGVRFMAETVKMLLPEAEVLHPVPESGCPMAEMADASAVRRLRAEHPDASAVCYVNSSAAVKAEVDICCTSGNVEKVIASIPEERPVIFLPDANLGGNISRRTGRRFILWPGCGPVHDSLRPEDILKAREEHPGWPVLVHPECRPEVVALCDEALSTAGILKRAREIDAPGFIIATERGLLPRLQSENPGKGFAVPGDCLCCRDMKLFTPENLLECIETGRYPVELPSEIMEKARRPIERMLALR